MTFDDYRCEMSDDDVIARYCQFKGEEEPTDDDERYSVICEAKEHYHANGSKAN